MNKRTFGAILALLVVLALALPFGPASLEAQTGNRGRNNFDWIIARRINITPLGLTVAGDTSLTTMTVTTGTVTALTATDATLTSDLVLSAQTVLTVTNGGAIVPTGAVQVLASSGTVTPTITIPAAGKSVCFYNRSSTTINFADTGNQVLAGAFAMGQYDVLCGWSDGTRFIETKRSNN